MTISKYTLRKKIIEQTDDMDAYGLRIVIGIIGLEKAKWADAYQLFARSVFIERTWDLSEEPMSPMFEDAIVEALSFMPLSEETKKIKKLAREHRQLYKKEDAIAWARQFMLAYRTIPFDHVNDSSICKICGANSLHNVVMLHVGLQVGPFCNKCLRRIPKSWYCQK